MHLTGDHIRSGRIMGTLTFSGSTSAMPARMIVDIVFVVLGM